MIYMSKVADATTADGSTSWFKVAQDSYAGTTASWGTEILNANCGKRTFTVPKSLASGNYLVRAEALALHAAGSTGGAQFYMSCYQSEWRLVAGLASREWSVNGWMDWNMSNFTSQLM
jgi:lytic cellulose monooxygenase (C1-hydroxylating)